MIRQIVAWNFPADSSDDIRQSLFDELDTFPDQFPMMRNWTRGDNISNRDQTYAHAFVVDFDNEDDLNAYLSSEPHERFVAERWRPNISDRAIITFEA